nr:hypothetical protein [Tanacetum cinerariifolium]
MSWEDFKTLTREEICPSNEMKKLETELWNYAMVGAGHDAYIDRFHELARLVPYLVTPEAMEPKTIQKAVQIAGALTDEALRNRSIKKNPEKIGNEGEPIKDRNMRDDNKKTMIVNAFATTANPVRGGYTGTAPKCATCNYNHSPETPCRTCFNCNCLGHFAKDCRVVPRNVNPINARNPVARTCYECGSTDHIKASYPRLNQVRGRAFMLGAEEARQDPNIMTDIEPSDLCFSYEIKITSEQLVEIDKVLRVLGEKLKEKVRQLMSAKDEEKKQEEVVVVKDIPEVFPEDLSGLLPVHEVKFQIELVPRAMSVAKSPYHLAPSEMKELSGLLKEL